MAKRKRNDPRTERIAEIKELLRIIDEKIKDKVITDVIEYEIASDLGRRRIKANTIEDLIKVRELFNKELLILEQEINREEKKSSRQVLVRF